MGSSEYLNYTISELPVSMTQFIEKNLTFYDKLRLYTLDSVYNSEFEKHVSCQLLLLLFLLLFKTNFDFSINIS